ncbi:MAG: apolipoprotein acyltransferase [Rhodobacter sp.]|nr:apolipoprotein acyltransferase [Rhodobacter sp.]
MIAAIFASIGLVCGYLFARADDRTRLGRMKYAFGFAITFAILGEVLGIALDRFLPPL